MKVLGSYPNGNYTVTIYDDGTKVRENDLAFFQSEFPENIDIKITNKCNIGCPMCHEKSTPDGANADLLNLKFINTLRPYTELAIGGGNVFENSEIMVFLMKLKEKKIIANVTVNQYHFEKYYNDLLFLMNQKFIYGLGVSLVDPTNAFLSLLKNAGKNVVLHVINGIVTEQQIEILKNRGIKILFLGYKNFGRGKDYQLSHDGSIYTNQEYVHKNLDKIFSYFKVVSFDNLSIKQLEPKRFLSKKQYDEFYMGDDGQFTMYIDAVKQEFARNSTATIRYPILDNIDDMFNIVKAEK